MAENDTIRVDLDDQIIVVAFGGAELDYEASGRLRTRIIAALQEHENLPVVVDLTGVGMLPSVSIGALIQVCQVVRGNGQRFLLAGLAPVVRETLRICRLDRIFELHDTLDAALASLRP